MDRKVCGPLNTASHANGDKGVHRGRLGTRYVTQSPFVLSGLNKLHLRHLCGEFVSYYSKF